jgi:PAS domain S-box-containing protein
MEGHEMNDDASDTVCAFVEGASDAAFAIDRSLTIIGWNHAASELLGYQSEGAIGRHCSDVIQGVYPNGEPLCVPGCGGGYCFYKSQSFEARACLAHRQDGAWVGVNFSSVVISKAARASLHSDAIAVIYVRRSQEQATRHLTDKILRIFTFGHFGIIVGDKDLTAEHWERRQSLTVLKILAAHAGRAVPRDVLIDYLWPEVDEKSGRKRIKAIVYSLRRQLRLAGLSEQLIETANEAYLLRREAIWVDCEVFEKFAAEGDTKMSRRRWFAALKCYKEADGLYRGDYLEEDIHTEWCAEERERYRQIHMEMLINMAECHEHRAEYAEAVAVDRKILSYDSCRESTHRALMQCLVRLGHSESAIAQYRQCQRALARELDVEPMPETEELYRSILAGQA